MRRPQSTMWRFKRPVAAQPGYFVAAKSIGDSFTTTDEKELSRPPPPDRDVEFGALAAVKTLYAGKNSRGENFDWVDTPPRALSKKVAKAHDRVGSPFS